MKIPKIIAMYLPQFHPIPENDKWWGEGFTEWTNVKKGAPLFRGHYQPKEPLNENYYNLLNLKTREWQSELATRYGIYGFCYYHYWFKGKKILEKPAEEILNLKTPSLPFCFSWANESWSRSWYSIKRELLIQQEYGDENDWADHFYYLLLFFKDERYIKVDNKPLFLIYKPSLIPEIDKMINFWEKLAVKEGFNGIHVVETLTKTQARPCSKFSEAVMFYEPGYTIQYGNLFKSFKFSIKTKISELFSKNYLFNKFFYKIFINTIDYDKFYKIIINRKLNRFIKKQYLGLFVNFDDTARRGNRAYIFNNVTPEKFEKYTECMLKKSSDINSDFLFITAWNEWAEGAYLEPDKKNNYDFLKAIRKARLNLN